MTQNMFRRLFSIKKRVEQKKEINILDKKQTAAKNKDQDFLKNRPFDVIPFARPKKDDNTQKDTPAFLFWETYAEKVFKGGNGTIFFFNREKIKAYDEYVQMHHTTISQKIQQRNRDFLYKTEPSLSLFNTNVLSYYYPFWNSEHIMTFMQEYKMELWSDMDNKLFEYVGYTGDIKAGFLSFVDGNIAIVGIKKREQWNDFVSNYLDALKPMPNRYYSPFSRVYFHIAESSNDIYIDQETKESIRIIKEQMDNLVETGQMFYAAPIIELYCKKLTKDTVQISPLWIDADYRIVLPEYGNMEIKMGHLTKAIYFFFLLHPEGVNLASLPHYKEELLNWYQNISYRISLDQMKESIDNLVRIKTGLIYQHLSRIKSAFLKKMDDVYACHYYVQGLKGESKKIRLSSDLIDWRCHVQNMYSKIEITPEKQALIHKQNKLTSFSFLEGLVNTYSLEEIRHHIKTPVSILSEQAFRNEMQAQTVYYEVVLPYYEGLMYERLPDYFAQENSDLLLDRTGILLFKDMFIALMQETSILQDFKVVYFFKMGNKLTDLYNTHHFKTYHFKNFAEIDDANISSIYILRE